MRKINHKKIYTIIISFLIIFSASSVTAQLEPINGGVVDDSGSSGEGIGRGYVPPIAPVLKTNDNKPADKLDYVALEPDAFKGLETSAPTGSPLADFLGQVFSFGIAAAVVLALIMLVYAGILKMTTDSWTKQDDAKTTIENALYGLGLALVSYIILYTINPCLVQFISTRDGCSTTNTFLFGSSGPNLIYGPSLPTEAQIQAGDLDGVRFVQANNFYPSLDPEIIMTSSNPDGYCNDQSNPRCTSLENIPAEAIDKINSLGRICSNCVIITGGTEIGHENFNPEKYPYAHGSERSTVDLDYNKQVIEALIALGLKEGDKRDFKTKNNVFVCELNESDVVNCDQMEGTEGHIHVQF